MSKFVVVVFPNGQKAAEGERLLDELNEAGTLNLYATAIVGKNVDGKVSQEETKGKGPRGAVLGALVGGLVGMLGGPPVAALGAAGGTLLGGYRDAIDLGVGFEFLDEVSRELKPGHWAVVALMDEEWVTPLDARMESLGGIVLRSWREDFEDQRLRAAIELARMELAQYKAELAQARDDGKARLTARINEAQDKLKRASERMEARIDRLREEMEAKVDALQQQAAHAKQEAKAGMDRRITEIRANHEKRSARLRQALAEFGKDAA